MWKIANNRSTRDKHDLVGSPFLKLEAPTGGCLPFSSKGIDCIEIGA